MKVDHRKAYEDAGLSMPGGASVSKVAGKSDAPTPEKKTATPKGKKRAVAVMSDNGEEDEEQFFASKPKKNKKEQSECEDTELQSQYDEGVGMGVKDEDLDDEI